MAETFTYRLPVKGGSELATRNWRIDFGFLSQEPADAEESARWIFAQPWCDGTIGIVGISYLASASISLASSFPDRVKAAVWVTIPVSPDTLTWQVGALRLHHAPPYGFA